MLRDKSYSPGDYQKLTVTINDINQYVEVVGQVDDQFYMFCVGYNPYAEDVELEIAGATMRATLEVVGELMGIRI